VLAEDQLTPNDAPDHLTTLYQEQQQIGWKHLYSGKWTVQWRLQAQTEKSTKNGLQWVVRNLLCIWRFLYSQWKERSEQLHSDLQFEKQRETNYLDITINELISESEKIQPTLTHTLRNIKNKLSHIPIVRKRTWLINNKQYIRNQIKNKKRVVHRNIQVQYTQPPVQRHSTQNQLLPEHIPPRVLTEVNNDYLYRPP
jgi:hypothetical protein